MALCGFFGVFFHENCLYPLSILLQDFAVFFLWLFRSPFRTLDISISVGSDTKHVFTNSPTLQPRTWGKSLMPLCPAFLLREQPVLHGVCEGYMS